MNKVKKIPQGFALNNAVAGPVLPVCHLQQLVWPAQVWKWAVALAAEDCILPKLVSQTRQLTKIEYGTSTFGSIHHQKRGGVAVVLDRRMLLLWGVPPSETSNARNESIKGRAKGSVWGATWVQVVFLIKRGARAPHLGPSNWGADDHPSPKHVWPFLGGS